MQDVKYTLDRLTPPLATREPDWSAVVRDARTSRVLWAVPRLAVVAAVVGLAAFMAVAPWRGSERAGVLDRALAAVDDGPVLHAVVRQGWGGDLIDLETGKRARLNGEREIWFDRARGLHAVSRFGGVFQSEELYGPGDVPRFEAKTLGLLAEGYRNALESGRARLLGPGVAYGVPVYWIRVDAEWLPDSADGKLHEWAHDVGVSRASFEPVATRETRDGKLGPDGPSRVLELEMLGQEEGDFTKSGRKTLDGTAFRDGSEAIELSQAAAALGRTPLWLGREHSGLPLAQVGLRTTLVGRQQETELTGRAAAERKACAAEMRRMRTRPRRPACLRGLGSLRSFLIRGGKVYVQGPVVWGKEHKGVQLLYGKGTYPKEPIGILGGPAHPGPHVHIQQTTNPHPGFFRGALGYAPPEGSVIVFGGRIGNLRRDGLYVAIEASSEELLLSAARALRPLDE
jgi:hypothetical protein